MFPKSMLHVSIKYEDGGLFVPRGLCRKVFSSLISSLGDELMNGAYDGDKSFFSIGPLPQSRREFAVVLEKIS